DELVGGPYALARALAVWRQSLAALAQGALPRVPGRVRRGPGGLRVVPALPVLPFDRLVFAGWRCDVVVPADGPLQELPESWPGPAVVLGAGNVTGIAPTDLLSILCACGAATVAKLHPAHAP